MTGATCLSVSIGWYGLYVNLVSCALFALKQSVLIVLVERHLSKQTLPSFSSVSGDYSARSFSPTLHCNVNWITAADVAEVSLLPLKNICLLKSLTSWKGQYCLSAGPEWGSLCVCGHVIPDKQPPPSAPPALWIERARGGVAAARIQLITARVTAARSRLLLAAGACPSPPPHACPPQGEKSATLTRVSHPSSSSFPSPLCRSSVPESYLWGLHSSVDLHTCFE